jgi:hypothetical protein
MMTREELTVLYVELGLDRYYKNIFNPSSADITMFRRIIDRACRNKLAK